MTIEHKEDVETIKRWHTTVQRWARGMESLNIGWERPTAEFCHKFVGESLQTAFVTGDMWKRQRTIGDGLLCLLLTKDIDFNILDKGIVPKIFEVAALIPLHPFTFVVRSMDAETKEAIGGHETKWDWCSLYLLGAIGEDDHA